MNKTKTVSLVAIVVILGSLFISQPVHATQNRMRGGNFFSELVIFISQKFGLDKTQVQNAIQDFRKQKKATITPRPTMTPDQRLAAERARLNALVKQGKITGDQENAIIAEITALLAKYPWDPKATPDAKKTQMQNMQNDLTAWAKAQGIDPKYVMPIFGRGFGGDTGGFKGRGPRPSQTP